MYSDQRCDLATFDCITLKISPLRVLLNILAPAIIKFLKVGKVGAPMDNGRDLGTFIT